MFERVQADEVALAHAQTTLARRRVTKKMCSPRWSVADDARPGDAPTNSRCRPSSGHHRRALAALDAMQTDSPEVAARRGRSRR